ncbi:lysosomal proton-coupled steroid conjugate and bile acid symporter SLC46A3-like [Palaemon carinicauda]|uniref:lysosomal proton-coupled steroid conjugate and bile acid symporter SLC46A3-like n=1 Tax=Palaemon carinicauda TaxID=392227 RepID=UPI0035B5E7F1
MLDGLRSRVKKALSYVTVEPIMFLDGACSWSMQVFMEVVQMNKICEVSIGHPQEVCSNLLNHTAENIEVQKAYSLFAFKNSIMMSVLPLIFVLFMGAWSDKYGRKIPFLMTTICHAMWSGGYLLNNIMSAWPMEFIYVATFFDSIGGCMQGFLSIAVAYISDVSDLKSRTSRVSTAVSLWYFGGPIGNLVGALAIQYGGISVSLGIVFMIHLGILFYIIFFIKESHGPFAVLKPVEEGQKSEVTPKKEDITWTKMLLDFFNWRRAAEAFKTAFKSRDGYARAIFLTVVASNMIRRVARGFYMYPFVRTALGWDEAIYTYWSSYRTLLAAAGSLIMVPILTRLVSITDPLLIVIGSLSLIGEYCCYGFVSGAALGFFMWLGPMASVISNASIIAHKSMATKLVSPSEKGRVSAVLSATQGLMPMVGYAMYAPIYHATVQDFPEAQFFFGASMVAISMITFLVIHISHVTEEMKKADVEGAQSKEAKAEDPKKSKLDRKPSCVSETESTFVSETSDRDDNTRQSAPERKDDLTRQGSVSKLHLAARESVVSLELADKDLSVPCYENRMSDAEILESERENVDGNSRCNVTNRKDKIERRDE